jgi:Relaxase/Mobilisation nuclease domain
MVIKGGARGGAVELAAHLVRTDTNERAEVIELRGLLAKDLKGALREMDAQAIGTQCTRTLYHASINVPDDEQLTPQQWAQSVDRLEKHLGLQGHARAVVMHEKQGREHVHVVWSRIDTERHRAVRDSHNYTRHEEVARDLEREFGLRRVQGAHVERDGQPRPERTPNEREMQQQAKTGVSIEQVKADMAAAWQTTRNGTAFQREIAAQGYQLAKGDKRDAFLVIDETGGLHALRSRLDGVKTKAIRERFSDLEAVPDVEQARAMQRQAREMIPERTEPIRAPEIAPEPPKAVQRPPEVQEAKPAERVDRQAEARARAEEERAAQRQAAQIAARAEQQKQEAAAAKLEAEIRAREKREQELLQDNLDKAAERQFQALGQKHVRELKAFQGNSGSQENQHSKPAGITGLFSRAADRLNPARLRERQAEEDRRKREAEERRRQELEATLQRQERERVALEKQIAETQRQQMQEFHRLQEKIREQRGQAPKAMEPRQQSKEHGGGIGRERKGPGRGGPRY